MTKAAQNLFHKGFPGIGPFLLQLSSKKRIDLFQFES